MNWVFIILIVPLWKSCWDTMHVCLIAVYSPVVFIYFLTTQTPLSLAFIPRFPHHLSASLSSLFPTSLYFPIWVFHIVSFQLARWFQGHYVISVLFLSLLNDIWLCGSDLLIYLWVSKHTVSSFQWVQLMLLLTIMDRSFRVRKWFWLSRSLY